MIVKLQTGVGKWNYFEGQEIEVDTFVPFRKVDQDPEIQCVLRGVLEVDDSESEPYAKRQYDYLDKVLLTVLHISSGTEQYRQIATDFPGYIMNNDGKTIDRIN